MCPGEEVCTTSKLRGVIAKRKGATLENFCHGVQTAPDREKGKRRGPRDLIIPGCERFPTKPENTPPFLVGAIDTAEDLRRWHKWGKLPDPSVMTAWEAECFDVAYDCEQQVISEEREREAVEQRRKAGAGGRDLPSPQERRERFHEMEESKVPEFARKWFKQEERAGEEGGFGEEAEPPHGDWR